MSDVNVVKLLQPGSFSDPLTEVLRNGARALLAQAIEAEVADFLAQHVDLKTATGVRRVVRHGHLPEREVMTGIGPVGVRQPRVRYRGAADGAARIRFTPAILPRYARRSRSTPHRWKGRRARAQRLWGNVRRRPATDPRAADSGFARADRAPRSYRPGGGIRWH